MRQLDLVVPESDRRAVNVEQARGAPLADRLSTVAFHVWLRRAGKSLCPLDQFDVIGRADRLEPAAGSPLRSAAAHLLTA